MESKNENTKLLLVDDEEDFLASAASALKRRKFDVHTACSGEEAIIMLRKDRFDAAVIDVKMPGMDGVELFGIIKKEFPEIPVIILTGHGSITQAFATSKEGVYDYLNKPCSMDDLAEKINKAVLTGAGAARHDKIRENDIIHVLLVDDEADLLVSLERVLKRRKFSTYTAASGDEALSIVKDTEIDVVILDIKMPGMDGLEVLEIMKRDYPLIEVILLTGHPDVDNAFRGVKMGAREYFVKPANIEELAEAVRAAFIEMQVKKNKMLDKQRERMINNIIGRCPG